MSQWQPFNNFPATLAPLCHLLLGHNLCSIKWTKYIKNKAWQCCAWAHSHSYHPGKHLAHFYNTEVLSSTLCLSILISSKIRPLQFLLLEFFYKWMHTLCAFYILLLSVNIIIFKIHPCLYICQMYTCMSILSCICIQCLCHTYKIYVIHIQKSKLFFFIAAQYSIVWIQ